jgi:DNA-binding HxlR family transcriptional regulator
MIFMKTGEKHITIPDFMIILHALSNGEQTFNNIQNSTHITYAHISSILNLLITKGFVQRKTSSVFLYKLTKKGEEITVSINSLLEALKINDVMIFEMRNNSKRKIKEAQVNGS